jgi:hypothetical protein
MKDQNDFKFYKTKKNISKKLIIIRLDYLIEIITNVSNFFELKNFNKEDKKKDNLKEKNNDNNNNKKKFNSFCEYDSNSLIKNKPFLNINSDNNNGFSKENFFYNNNKPISKYEILKRKNSFFNFHEIFFKNFNERIFKLIKEEKFFLNSIYFKDIKYNNNDNKNKLFFYYRNFSNDNYKDNKICFHNYIKNYFSLDINIFIEKEFYKNNKYNLFLIFNGKDNFFNFCKFFFEYNKENDICNFTFCNNCDHDLNHYNLLKVNYFLLNSINFILYLFKIIVF